VDILTFGWLDKKDVVGFDPTFSGEGQMITTKPIYEIGDALSSVFSKNLWSFLVTGQFLYR